MTARVGVVLFPGSNCEHDVVWAIEQLGGDAEILLARRRHDEGRRRGRRARRVRARRLPAHRRDRALLAGDDTRSPSSRPPAAPSSASATASRCSPKRSCCPGALQKNAGLEVPLRDRRAARRDDRLRADEPGRRRRSVLRIPINHFEGNYVCDAATLDELRAEDRIVVRYVDNPNGSLDDIAGICNAGRNVVGLMPHPERASDPILGSDDGVVAAALAARAPCRVRGVTG